MKRKKRTGVLFFLIHILQSKSYKESFSRCLVH
nr:MAG TPA: hypothetical protein [Caudoviricetes sp.]